MVPRGPVPMELAVGRLQKERPVLVHSLHPCVPSAEDGAAEVADGHGRVDAGREKDRRAEDRQVVAVTLALVVVQGRVGRAPAVAAGWVVPVG